MGCVYSSFLSLHEKPAPVIGVGFFILNSSMRKSTETPIFCTLIVNTIHAR